MSSSFRHMSIEMEQQQEKKEAIEFTVDAPVTLTWTDLTVTLVHRRGPVHHVLDSLTGYAESGRLTALMGPSGSGKSTLLDALAGRVATNVFVSGSIMLNGQTAKLSYGVAAYVTQDDTLIGTLTVREMISYSARLRLPNKMKWSQKQEMIESSILEMGLQDCADTVIGNWHLRGISGGQKRRVSIALETLVKPRLLFLDEPTSGLDSAAAFFVVKTLRNLSRDGRTVIAAIHQPSSEVFQLFDNLYLLSRGKTIYFGRTSEANTFFAEAGFPCPTLRNLSDHFLRCINADFDEAKTMLKESLGSQNVTVDDPLETTTAMEAAGILTEHYYSSQYQSSVREKIDEIAKHKRDVPDLSGSRASFFMQAYILTKRSSINMSRDLGYYWLRLAMYVALGVCVGFIFYDVGTDYNSIQERGSCTCFLLGFYTFMSIGGFPSFVEDMKVFQRERMNGHYGVTAFVIGNTLSSMPFLLMISIASGTICYFMVHFHPGFVHYFYFILCLFSSLAVVESLMMAIASIVPNFLMGIIMGASIQGFLMLLCGFFRLPKDIPKPVLRYPVTYIGFLYYGLQGQFQNDFRGLLFDNRRPDQPKITGEYILENVFQIDLSRSKWWNLAVIFSMIIIYRILFFVMIKICDDVTPWIRGHFAKRRLQKEKRTSNENLQLPNTRGSILPMATPIHTPSRE